MPHKFKIGQTVHFQHSLGRFHAPPGRYVVTKRLPDQDGEPHYQIKNADETYERTARESELIPAVG